jgi:hypothetical protein
MGSSNVTGDPGAAGEVTNLVIALREAIRDNTLTSRTVKSAKQTLKRIGYVYDSYTYPPLRKSYRSVKLHGRSPTDLAEALLWKLGMWPAYENFVRHHSKAESKPGKTGIVFFAFAKHLRNRDIPIYDQHVLRSLWAIGNLQEEDRALCGRVLIDRSGEWKESGSGADAEAAYRLFVSHMAALEMLGISNAQLDKLLMPLGQAL